MRLRNLELKTIEMDEMLEPLSASDPARSARPNLRGAGDVMLERMRGERKWWEGQADECSVRSEKCSSNRDELEDGGMMVGEGSTRRRVDRETIPVAVARRSGVRAGGWEWAAGLWLLLALAGLGQVDGIVVNKKVRSGWKCQTQRCSYGTAGCTESCRCAELEGAQQSAPPWRLFSLPSP